jgi:nicotinamidase-related amidase
LNGIQGLCDAGRSVLLVIDVQERLARAMPAEDLNPAVQSILLLARAAALLQIPVMRTEQYPKGLGPTLDSVARHLPDAASAAMEKTGFSCCAAAGLPDRLQALQRRQIILAGMETHVCVLQTALDLKQRGYEVFVAEDACCARSRGRSRNGLARLRQSDILITHSESVLFEWLRDAAHPQFRAVSTLLKEANPL